MLLLLLLLLSAVVACNASENEVAIGASIVVAEDALCFVDVCCCCLC